MSKVAEEIIALQSTEESKASNFRNLYQEVANYMLPRENQITLKQTPGKDKSKNIYDPTAMLDLQDMVSGLSAAFFPPGQQSFGVTVYDRQIKNLDHVKRYLSLATQITHDELFVSNFMLQLNETLSSLVGFGTGNLYSEWSKDIQGLNFKDWDVSFYVIKESAQGKTDTVILKYPLTARQAVQEFGDKAGEKVLEAAKDLKKESDVFDFIHIVRPRIERNRMLIDTLNAPIESLFVNVKEKIIVDEDGFYELPYAVPRWMKSSSEKYGRGQGTVILSCVKELQQMHSDLIECGNKFNNPPKEVLQDYEGIVKTTPGALNWVRTMGSIKAIEQNALGNFPITKDIIELLQGISHRAFFVDVFAPLANLPGDRRTQLEIIERVKQAMKKLALPVYRLQSELFAPVIKRCVLLLIRNGRIPSPPSELQGQDFGIEFIGELALAMQDQQSRAFQQFAGLVTNLDPVFPGAKDILSIDRALPDVASSFGVKAEHLSTPEEIEAQRAERAADAQQIALMQAAQVAGKAYSDTSKKAEEGSPAAEVQEAVSA